MEGMNELEDLTIEITQFEQKTKETKKKTWTKGQGLVGLWWKM